MKKFIFITLLFIGTLLIGGCSIGIKTNKELEEERAKKQEINNIISGLNQQISGLEDTLLQINKEINLLQPKTGSGKKQDNGLELIGNEQMMSGLELSGLNFEGSTGIIEAINVLDQQQKTGSQLNWLEKIFIWFKKLFNSNNQATIGLEHNGLNQSGENIGLQISGDSQETTGTNQEITGSKSSILKTKTIKPTNTSTKENICSSAEISACVRRDICSDKCKENEDVLKARSIACEKDFGEGYISIRDTRISSYNCVCKEGYKMTEMPGAIELSDGTMASKRYCKKM